MSRALRTGAGVIALLAAAATARAQGMESAEALDRWVAAVRGHEPGKVDAAARSMAVLKYSERARLNPAMRMFLGALRGGMLASKTDAQQRIADLFHSVRMDPGLGAFVRRAAVLHTDAAVFADDFPAFVDDAPSPEPTAPRVTPDGGLSTTRRVRPGEEPSPLLSNEAFVLHTDGRVVGQARADWNWVFARALLDLLLPPAEHRDSPGPCRGAACLGTPQHSGLATTADVAFVGEWYHAVAAYLLAQGNHGDLRLHLEHGASMLPDDPRLLFDRGCLAEVLGSPLYQVLPGDPTYRTSHMTMTVPGEDRTDGEAEKLFRRAFAIDPAYTEARVRGARLLERRGLHDEASAELDAVFAGVQDRVVAFYAHLVAGRIAQARGRAADSLDHYTAALTLFASGQSALIGASQAAVMMSNVPLARSFTGRLDARAERYEADPWRLYGLGAGRDVNVLMAALWKHTGGRE